MVKFSDKRRVGSEPVVRKKHKIKETHTKFRQFGKAVNPGNHIHVIEEMFDLEKVDAIGYDAVYRERGHEPLEVEIKWSEDGINVWSNQHQEGHCIVMGSPEGVGVYVPNTGTPFMTLAIGRMVKAHDRRVKERNDRAVVDEAKSKKVLKQRKAYAASGTRGIVYALEMQAAKAEKERKAEEDARTIGEARERAERERADRIARGRPSLFDIIGGAVPQRVTR